MGSGKTEATIKQMIGLVEAGETCILTHPTKEMNSQVRRRILELSPNIFVETINGDTRPNKSVAELAGHLRRPIDKPHIVLTTYKAFESLPYNINPGRYHLRCDEIPNCAKSISARIPCNHSELTDAFEIVQRGPIYGEILVRDESKLRRFAENRQADAISEIYRPFALQLMDRNWQTFIDLKQYNEFKAGRRDDPFLRIFSLLKPKIFEGFKSVGLLGARAEETLLYKWWSRCGVQFTDDKEILSNLRYDKHENGDLIDFYYLSETNWSLYAQNEHPDLKGKFTEAVINKLKGKMFGWIDNKTFEGDSPFNSINGAVMLPHASHGRNDFQYLDNLAIITAFNYPPHISDFLQDYAGITKTEQNVAHDYHNTMQTIGRISIRDPNNDNRKIIILPDRLNAQWQSEVFPGSRVHSMNVDNRKPKPRGRPAIHENATERQRARRQGLADEQTALVQRLDLRIQSLGEAGNTSLCHDISINNIRNNVTSYQGSVVNNKKEGKSFPLVLSNRDFGIYLKGLHKRTIADKEDNHLIMSALCLPIPNDSTQRAEPNALFGRHIILDFDDSELKPLSLSRIFPNNEILCFNSYNHTKEKLRYRAIFITDDLVSPSVYKFVWYQIVQRIENTGYYGLQDNRPKGERKLHGIDNKPNIVTPFFMPSQPKTGEGFFYHYTKNRMPLPVSDWIEHQIMTRFDDKLASEAVTPSLIQQQYGSHEQFIEDAFDHYLRAITLPNPKTGTITGSNDALFNMTLALKGAGVERVDADIAMTRAANQSNSPRDRMGDKNRYLKRYW